MKRKKPVDVWALVRSYDDRLGRRLPNHQVTPNRWGKGLEVESTSDGTKNPRKGSAPEEESSKNNERADEGSTSSSELSDHFCSLCSSNAKHTQEVKK